MPPLRLPAPRLAAAIALVGLAAGYLIAILPPATALCPLLALGQISGEIKAGSSVCYQVLVPAKHFLHATAVQKGIDLAFALKTPDGKPILSSDSPNRTVGLEEISAITDSTGRYVLELQARAPFPDQGRYELRIDELHPARDRDLRWAKAALSYSRGEDERRLLRPESYLRSLGFYGKAERGWLQLGDGEHVALVRYRMGQVYERLNNHRKALWYFARVLPAWSGRIEEIELRIWIGLAHMGLDDLVAAQQAFEKALSLATGTQDHWGEASALSNIARLQNARGEIENAQRTLELCRERWHDWGDLDTEATVLGSLGGMYLDLGQPDRAIEACEAALAIRERLGKGEEKSPYLLHTLGKAYYSAEKTKAALASLKRGLLLARQVGDRSIEIHLINQIAYVNIMRGDLELAAGQLKAALTVAQAIHDRRLEANTQANLGGLALKRRDFGEAFRRFHASQSIYSQLKDHSALASVQYYLAVTNEQAGQLDAAKRDVEEALRLFERLRADPASRDQRAAFLASRYGYYELYVDILMQLDRQHPGQGFDVLAFEAAESARARTLLDDLAEGRNEIRSGIAPSLRARQMDLERQIAAKSQEMRQLAGASKEDERRRERLDSELGSLLADHDRLLAEIRTSSPRYAALVAPRPATLAEVRELLDDRTILLAYMLGEKRSFVWQVDRNGLVAHELPPRDELTKQIGPVVKMLGQRRLESLRPRMVRALGLLGKTLLGPVADRLGDKRIVIVADGALHSVSFAALPDPQAPPPTADVWPTPLGESHEISYLPSASVLGLLRKEIARRAPPQKMLAVLAHPVLERDDLHLSRPPGSQLPPFSSLGGLSEAVRDSTRDFGLSRLPDLPFTEEEAKAILRLVPPEMRFEALGLEANRKTAMDPKLGDYRYVHFATHSLLNTVHPQLTGIVLSQVDAAGRPLDGFLRSYEIYNLNLPVDLVVLSACRTALGRELRGEGTLGLTRAFMYAGAPRIVVSLWKVDDKATATLMEFFYEGLIEQKLPAAEALQAAEMRLRRNPAWSDPYYWAGFVLQGEWR